MAPNWLRQRSWPAVSCYGEAAAGADSRAGLAGRLSSA
jgi:hypothetical protein